MMDISETVLCEKFERSSRMNENRALKLFNNFSCSSCKVQFYIKDLTLKGSRPPVLLHCGHSICNNCIYQNLKGAGNFTCQICGFVSSWEVTVKSSKYFPLNLHMLGNLIVFQSSKFEKDKKLAFLTESNFDFNYAVSGQSDFFLQSDSRASICEECSMKAAWHCDNCKSNFCEICWLKVHSSAKSLTKHIRTALRDVLRNGFKKCQEHESQNLEFFCKNCAKAICSHCVVLQHQGEGHHSITLEEKNLEIFNEVKAAAEEADKMNKKMKQTLKDLKLKQGTFETSENLTYLNFGNEITRNFSRIHGLLQLEEERLLKELQEKSNERENCFRALQTQLEKQVEASEYLLRECKNALKQPQNSDLMDLHRQLTQVENFPCYLISKPAVKEQAKLTFDERLIDAIRLYCTLVLPSEELFELRSSSNLPEGYEVETLDVPGLEQNLGLESNSSCPPDLDTSMSDSSREFKREDSESINFLPSHPKEAKVFLERKNYCVRTSFIKSPGEFYVVLNSQRAQQRAIDRRAFGVARFSSVIPKAYKKDDVFLVKYNVDKKWYRGRVIEVIPSKREGGEDSVVVYYLDYGNFETVPISRLRPIPPDLLEESPLAIKCKLFDCVPQTGEWCADSTKTMEKILEKYYLNTATMFVIKVHPDCLEVDLSVIYLEGQIGRDIVSVRDALMFLGFSSFVHGLKVPRNATVVKYLEQCLPSVGESFEVTVSHVNCPSDFYVQKNDQDASYLYKLASDLQTYYEETREKGVIFNPTVDMACAALFSVDQRWYRAKIVDIPAKKMVTVFYVDYGNKETLPWTEIRKLKESFSKYPPMAFNCSLAGILPPNGKPWSSHAKSCLKKNMLMGQGRIVVQGISKSRQKLKVMFYKRANQMEYCLNSYFVDMGLAIKTCDAECLWLLNIQDKEENNAALKKGQNKSSAKSEGRTSKMKKNVRKNGHFRDKRKQKPSAKELRELHESEKQSHPEEQFSKDTVENEISEYKNIFKVKVQVLSCKSPSSIYITFPTLMKEFECLQAKLNDFYQDSASSTNEWTVGSSCVVFDSTKLSWFRASILSLLPNERVELFLKDVARVISESVSALRPLDPLFKKYSTCAIKCHLADVKPPGAEWPSISCEFLSEEIEAHEEVYMTRKGPTEKESLPIELWVQKVLTRGALEPIKKEWITLNRLLVSQGLAIPEKIEMWLGTETSTEDEYSDEQKSLADTQGESIEPPSDPLNETDSSDVFVPTFDSNWIPPLPITKSCFTGVPTYVDYNAGIFMYDKQDEETLKKIREDLFQVYENSKPTPDDCFWIPNQLCIAKYHVDNFWYRGRVLQKNEDMTYEVLFVDYGNVETCQVSDLRKRIKMHDIPILSHKFKLSGIEAVGESGVWSEPTIDIIHSLIVDKLCEVKILKYPEDPTEPYIATLKLIEEDVDFATFLVEKKLALLNVPFSFTSPKPVSDSDGSRYVPLIIPDDCNEFFLEVTNISSDTEFFANIIIDQTLPSNLKTVLSEFTTLQKTVTEEGPTQPYVEDITEGHPCCCLDFTNNKWCRGEVENLAKNKNSACIFYVDYGTEEVLHKDFIRECKDNWLNLPKMAVKFKLGGVEKCSNISDFAYGTALSSCMNGKLFAEILNRHENFLEVRLLTDKNGVLVYQEMIDEGLMKLI